MSKSENKQAELNKQSKARGKGAEITLIALFCAFFAVFFALILILPKKEGELSQNERRMLAKAPDFTFDSILSGDFAEQTDTWLEDHFPGRAFFVPFYSYVSRAAGRNAVENIIAGRDNRLFAAPEKANDETIIDNAKVLRKFIEENELNALSAVIPSAGYVLENELPKLHRTYHDGDIINKFNSYLGESAKVLDVEALIKSQKEPGKYYYKTDHHLSMQGSYLIYTELCEKLGFEPVPEAEFQKTPYEFYGTSFGRSGLMLTPPDTLEIWLGKTDAELVVTTVDGKNKAEYKGVTEAECLKEGVADKYAAYLYGNHGITSIVNPKIKTGTLMVFKDSYANAVVPFLAAHYHEIIMIDTRYYNVEMETPGEIVSRLRITDFIILCGTDTVNANVEAVWMTLKR